VDSHGCAIEQHFSKFIISQQWQMAVKALAAPDRR
jgi:hypothetical protein